MNGGEGGGEVSKGFSECVKCFPSERFYFHGVSEMTR